MKCVVETTPPTHHGRALAPGPPPRRAHLSLPSSAPSGHTTARLKADILVSDSEPRPAKSPRSAPLRRVRQAKPRFATQTGSKPNARPATHSLRVLPQRRESAQFNSYISEATTRQWWCGCYKNNHANTGMPRRLLQSTRLHQGAGNQHKPSPLHRLLGATATRPASPTAPAARACRPCPSTLQKGGLGI